MEIYFISAYKATERDDFYNISEGGLTNRAMKGINNPLYGKKGLLSPNYGRKRSEQTKQRMSKAQKGHPSNTTEEMKIKISNTMKQKHIKPTPQAYAKLKGKKGYAHTGRPHKHVLCVELGMVYESQSEIERVLGIPQANIHKVLKRERPRAGGYSFAYTESEVGPYVDSKNGGNHKLECGRGTNDVLSISS